MSESKHMQWKLEVVILPVSDVDRAKSFYVNKVGFHLDYDNQITKDIRVIQITPPGSACSISFGTGIVDTPPGSVKQTQLTVSDINAARSELLSGGIAVSKVKHFDNGSWIDGPGGEWNSFIFFSDPDGNSWVVQESPNRF